MPRKNGEGRGLSIRSAPAGVRESSWVLAAFHAGVNSPATVYNLGVMFLVRFCRYWSRTLLRHRGVKGCR